MKTTSRASLPLAALIACAFLGTADVSQAIPPAEPDGMKSYPSSIAELVSELEDWLDRESVYKRREIPVTVRIVGAEAVASAAMMPGVQGFALRGYYDPANATIYLVEPWSPENPHDASVLLHELVHHRQHSLTDWECPNAQERPAYRLQDRWLSERGLDAHINRFMVLMISRCPSGPFDAGSTVDRQ
jgi:hypothetical protein